MAEYYPPVGFHFLVKFENFSPEADTRFQEVTGLGVTVNTEEVSEGGENRFTHKLPKRTSYDTLVLKRGIIQDSKITEWCREAVENLNFTPQNILVSLLNEQHEPLCSWSIVHAYPVKWSFTGLNAQNNDLLIESIELNYQYYTLKNL